MQCIEKSVSMNLEESNSQCSSVSLQWHLVIKKKKSKETDSLIHFKSIYRVPELC